jgi:hypothetical protein
MPSYPRRLAFAVSIYFLIGLADAAFRMGNWATRRLKDTAEKWEKLCA